MAGEITTPKRESRIVGEGKGISKGTSANTTRLTKPVNTKDSRKVIEAAFADEGRKKQQEPKPSWYNGGSKVKSVKTEVKKKEEEKKPSWYNGGSKVKSVKVKVKKP